MLRLGLGIRFAIKAAIAAAAAVGNFILTEGGDSLTTEAGDNLILES